MNMDLKDLLNTLLSKTNISKLNICQDKIEIYIDGLMEFTQEVTKPIEEAKIHKYTMSQKGALSKARALTKDPRWIRIIDELNMTPKEWMEREYPDVEMVDMYRAMRRRPGWSVRQCAEYCQE